MTDCGNAEIRDLLPDLAADQLSASEAARVQAHVDRCRECAAEVEVLRLVRAVRPRAVHINVASIVASLPKPSAAVVMAPSRQPDVVSLDSRRAAAVAPSRSARSLWRMAATIGIIIAGGWSVVMVRSGGLGMMRLTNADSLRLSAAVQGVDTGSRMAASDGSTSAAGDGSGSAVSFGNLGDYTEEEIQRILDRVEQWDGATSTETVTTTPILPVGREGAGD